MLARPDHREPALGVARAAAGRDRDAQLAPEVAGRERLGVAEHLDEGAGDDDLPAVPSRPGPEVHDVVGGADRLLVVLHDEHRVPQLLELAERREQPRVVPLVQPDGGLVQDVEHAHEPAADLRREPDALGLAARE